MLKNILTVAALVGAVALVAAGEDTMPQYPTVTLPAPSSHRVGHFLIAQAVLQDCVTCAPRYGRDVKFTSSNSTVLKFVAYRNWNGTTAGNTALFQALKPGVVTLTGTTQSNTHGTTTVTVYDPTASIQLSPSPVTGPLKDTVRIHAQGLDSTGKLLWKTP